MQIPAAGCIERAVDELKTIDKKHLIKQSTELCSAVVVTDQSFEDGYNLGLQTARVILKTSTLLQSLDIDSKDLL